MSQNNQSLLDVLKGLGSQISAADAADNESIIQIGTSIEGICDDPAISGGPAAELFTVALELLQAIYLEAVEDPAAALNAIARASEAVGDCLANKDDKALDGVREELQTILDRSAQSTQPPQSQDTPASNEGNSASIDDILARLVGLTAADTDDLRDLSGLLQEMASSGALAGDLCAHITVAVESIESILTGKADDPDASLAAAGRELEAVSLAMDDASADGASSPQAPGEVPADVTEANEADGPKTLPADADLELMKEYIVESLDHITAGEAALLTIETNPNDAEQIATVFRAFHTIKGTSGFLGLNQILGLAHLAENLLDRARSGEITLTGGYADLSLRSCDTLKTMIEALEGAQPGDQLVVPDDLENLLKELSDPEAAGVDQEAGDETMRVGDILVGKGQASRRSVEKAATSQGEKLIGQALVESGAVAAGDVAKALRTQKQLGSASPGDATIRVNTDRLDSLIDLVGELVIAQSMVAQDPLVTEAGRSRLARNVAHSGKIIRELQDLTMALRMVPLKGTFQKMLRLVRDLARKSGKSVRLVTEGEDTEIDRNMVEVLKDPLVHMIRNSVDHGIESAEGRRAENKPETGTVCLRAYHSAGSVVIELQDDGKGLDKKKIVAKAVDRGLIEPGRDLTDSEAFSLIFQPGFSTAEKVTDVSGRGVGMDVVKKGIDALHGWIDVTSKAGEGSTFTLRVPLTMAITDAMLLRVGQERYLLPTICIEQSFRPEPQAISTVVGRGEMVMLRGQLLPVFRLYDLFNVAGDTTDPSRGLLVVVAAEGKRCAIMVDELLGQQQVVIKTLGETFANVSGVAGGGILGDGRVGLILDAAGLIKLASQDTIVHKTTKAVA